MTYEVQHKVRGLDGVLRDADERTPATRAGARDDLHRHAAGQPSSGSYPQTPPEPSQAPPHAPKAEQAWEGQWERPKAARPRDTRPLPDRISDAYDDAAKIATALAQAAPEIHDPRQGIDYDRARVSHSRSASMPHGSVVLHQSWLDCQQRIDSAHYALWRLGWPTRWQMARRATDAVPVDEWVLRQALAILRSGLTWLANRMEQGLPVNRPDAYELCGQIRSALMCWPWHRDPPETAPEPLCTNRVNGCMNPPRPGGSQCSTCANWRSKHGSDRIVGEDGRGVKAS